MKPAAAGIFYFAIVFAAGFVLGAVRTVWLAPAIGELAATLLELPVILALSWAACLFIIARMKIDARVIDRIVMGAVAFALLIGADVALGLTLMDRTPEAQAAAMTAPPALVGLGGQMLFAVFPLIGLAVRR